MNTKEPDLDKIKQDLLEDIASSDTRWEMQAKLVIYEDVLTDSEYEWLSSKLDEYCRLCGGEGEVTHSPGLDNEFTTTCPCTTKDEDFTGVTNDR